MKAAKKFEVLQQILLAESQLLNAISALISDVDLKNQLVQHSHDLLRYVQEREWE